MFNVLVVDDDNTLRMTVSHALGEANYHVEQAADGEEAVNKVVAGNFHLVLLDVNMPKLNGLEALKQIKAYDASVIVIMLTAFSNVRDAIEATKEGAYNYLEKPVKAENLVYMINRALKAHSMVQSLSLRAPVIKLPGGTTFVGESSEMKKIFNIIDKLSRVDTAVLIRGQSGTGKELVANAIHYNGPRKDERFVTVNCSAIPETLIESEFFGHEKGAFTGADNRKIGKFQYADGGTLFLDEIGDISPGMQVKLLRVLQEKKFTPVGSNREIEVNVRIVAATNRNLEEMIKSGQFREDLFYRLNVLPIYLPALAERKGDIEVLVKYFVEKFNELHHKKISGVSVEAMNLLRHHSWPGNIRELENVIEHAFVVENSSEISVYSLPDSIHSSVSEVSLSNEPVIEPKGLTEEGRQLFHSSETENNGDRLDFQASKEAFEKEFLVRALRAFGGKINQTALHANIPKKTLLRKLEKYGLNAKDYQ
ncbi:MAG: sigma-54-dependent transcriptional regulator [Bacteriovoracia bacterium]